MWRSRSRARQHWRPAFKKVRLTTLRSIAHHAGSRSSKLRLSRSRAGSVPSSIRLVHERMRQPLRFGRTPSDWRRYATRRTPAALCVKPRVTGADRAVVDDGDARPAHHVRASAAKQVLVDRLFDYAGEFFVSGPSTDVDIVDAVLDPQACRGPGRTAVDRGARNSRLAGTRRSSIRRRTCSSSAFTRASSIKGEVSLLTVPSVLPRATMPMIRTAPRRPASARAGCWRRSLPPLRREGRTARR